MSTTVRNAKSATKRSRPGKPRARPQPPAPLDESQIASRMLAVLADPNLLGSTTSEKIQKSGLSKDVWYRHRNNPKFRIKMARACTEAMDEHTASVLEALAESAQAPGAARNQAWSNSTGPRSAVGKERAKMNAFQHGARSAEAAAPRKTIRLLLKYLRAPESSADQVTSIPLDPYTAAHLEEMRRLLS